MPILQVNMMEGRSEEQKERLIEELTVACVRALNAPQESVRVMINEMPKQHFGIGGSSAKKLGK
ncbi:2-hydroxymuconate tautomerase [Neptuniibacter sp.]|uniref:2-hydroxymuconate tautomerase n=1 Tax=Neptuniibacter sp. TaxID=1962643 RepID=UPI00261E8C7F|nr:2-hydroxymuconate tautomerase [Neptuniibacter sp.]MCP4596910.1 4-oxalocrotonate tautomerase family protein [Neptuniibacter sp.]